MLSRILWNYRKAMKNYYSTTEELKRIQDKKFRFIARYVYDNIPFYHDVLKASDKSPQDFKGVDDLRWFPLLNKKNISENFPSRITNPMLKVSEIASTSGTTGKPFVVHMSAMYCDLMLAIRMRKFRIMGVGFFDKAARVPYFGAMSPDDGQETKERSVWSKLYKTLFGTNNRSIPVARLTTIGLGPDNLREVALSLYRLKPDLIYTRPSYARKLSEVLAREGVELHTKVLNVTSEYLSSACRKELERFYEAEIFDSYGSNEFGGLGFECPEHSGIHLNSDYFIFEFLGADGQAVSGNGERAEIVVSSLHNLPMPLLRYRQGDNVILEEEGRCPCGSYLPRLKMIEGRPGDGLLSLGGLRIAPGIVINFFENSLGLRDFQIIQRSEKKLLVKLKAPSTDKKTTESISRYLKQLVGSDIELEIVNLGEKEFPPKYRPVICEVKN